jgi:hypothetical protein
MARCGNYGLGQKWPMGQKWPGPFLPGPGLAPNFASPCPRQKIAWAPITFFLL